MTLRIYANPKHVLNRSAKDNQASVWTRFVLDSQGL